MAGLDHMLATSLADVIQQHLGKNALQKIEKRLFEKFGISFIQAVEQFDKLDLVLREFFGKGTDGLERKFLDQLCLVKSKKSEKQWLTIYDTSIVNTVLENFGDSDKKKILKTTSSTPKIIYDIIEESNIPQTSGYRKVNTLIDDGLLIQDGFVTKDKKKINKYVCAFNNLRININSNELSIDIQLNDAQIKQSSILHTIIM